MNFEYHNFIFEKDPVVKYIKFRGLDLLYVASNVMFVASASVNILESDAEFKQSSIMLDFFNGLSFFLARENLTSIFWLFESNRSKYLPSAGVNFSNSLISLAEQVH